MLLVISQYAPDELSLEARGAVECPIVKEMRLKAKTLRRAMMLIPQRGLLNSHLEQTKPSGPSSFVDSMSRSSYEFREARKPSAS